MNFITPRFGSSVGKKPIMAISGFAFCAFLAAHLAGNLTIYWGKESFNTYAQNLHSLGILITITELGLFLLGIIHVITAIILFFENKKARPTNYAVTRRAGGQTLGSATMVYTGAILFVFIVVHLFDFHFVDKTNTSIFSILLSSFSSIGYVAFYVLAVSAVSVHVSHGFWSAFQTLGINHMKYTNIIKLTGLMFSVIIGIGFAFIPIYLLFSS